MTWVRIATVLALFPLIRGHVLLRWRGAPFETQKLLAALATRSTTRDQHPSR